MKTVHVLSTGRFDTAQLDRFRAVSPRLSITQYTARSAGEVPSEAWSDVEVLVTFQILPAPDLAPRLRWVQALSAGVNHALEHPVFAGDVVLTSASGIHAINVGEYALALMLALAQRIPALIDHQRRADWPQGRLDQFLCQELRGATVGVVGYGSIGREVGRLASGFAMRVLAYDEYDDRTDYGYIVPGVGDPNGVIPQRHFNPDELKEMLAECDYVVLAVPLTPATKNLIGLDELRAMKPSAFLINVARGGVVDEAALTQALEEGWIAGAGLDVFVEEPLPTESRLWGMDNVILSPHIAGPTPHYNERAADVFVENLLRYLDGRPLLNQIDFQKGY